MGIIEPNILTQSTFFWKPKTNARDRRDAENYYHNEVAEFFSAIGLRVTRRGDCTTGEFNGIKAVFYYRQTASNVYKTLEVTKRGGKKSNITALRNLAKKTS